MGKLIFFNYSSEYDSHKLKNLEIIPENVFNVDQKNNRIEIIEGKMFNESITLTLTLMDKTVTQLRRNFHDLHVLIEFAKTKFRKMYQFHYDNSKSIEIELKRQDIYGKGGLDLIVTKETGKLFERVGKIGNPWIIGSDDLPLESDINLQWIDFSDEKYYEKYAKYDQIVMDFNPHHIRPTIYLDSSLEGLADMLQKESYRGKNLSLQKSIFLIIHSYTMLGNLLFDALDLSSSSEPIEQEAIFNEERKNEQRLRRFAQLFGLSIDEQEKIMDSINSLITDSGGRGKDEMISEMILNIQEIVRFRELITDIVVG